MLQTAFSFTFIFPLRSAIKRLLVLVRGTRFEDRFCFRFGKRRSREKWRHVFRFNTPFIRLFNWPTNNNLPYLKRQSNWRMVQLSSWCVVGARLCQNDLFWPIIGASSGGCVVRKAVRVMGARKKRPHFCIFAPEISVLRPQFPRAEFWQKFDWNYLRNETQSLVFFRMWRRCDRLPRRGGDYCIM